MSTPAEDPPQRTLVLCGVVIAYVINPGSGGLKLACATLEPGDNPALPGQLRVDLTRAELPLAQVPRVEDLPGLVADILALSAAWPAPDAIVGRGGVERTLQFPLDDDEENRLAASAAALTEVQRSLGL